MNQAQSQGAFDYLRYKSEFGLGGTMNADCKDITVSLNGTE